MAISHLTFFLAPYSFTGSFMSSVAIDPCLSQSMPWQVVLTSLPCPCLSLWMLYACMCSAWTSRCGSLWPLLFCLWRHSCNCHETPLWPWLQLEAWARLSGIKSTAARVGMLRKVANRTFSALARSAQLRLAHLDWWWTFGWALALRRPLQVTSWKDWLVRSKDHLLNWSSCSTASS